MTSWSLRKQPIDASGNGCALRRVMIVALPLTFRGSSGGVTCWPTRRRYERYSSARKKLDILGLYYIVRWGKRREEPLSAKRVFMSTGATHGDVSTRGRLTSVYKSSTVAYVLAPPQLKLLHMKFREWVSSDRCGTGRERDARREC